MPPSALPNVPVWLYFFLAVSARRWDVGGFWIQDVLVALRGKIGGRPWTSALLFRPQLQESKHSHVEALLACDKTLKRGKVTLQQGIKKEPGIKTGPQVAVIGGS